MSNSDDLTVAYMLGYHSRDDEVADFKAQVEHLEGERNHLRTMLSRTLHKYGLIGIPSSELLERKDD